MSDEIAAEAARAWDELAQSARSDDGPREEQRRRLIDAAREHAELARLFPWTSIGTLCFSRCSEFPFTTDAPCVGVGPDLQFWVLPDAVVREEGTNPFLRTSKIEQALEAVIDRLPPDASIWLGSTDGR